MIVFSPNHGPLREGNSCHNPSGAGGGQFCGGFLAGEQQRSGKLGVPFTINPALNVRSSAFDPETKQIELGTGTDEWKLGRPGLLSIARLEIGHVTDPTYGDRKAQRIIDGHSFGGTYAEEFGAWRAAIRDSKGKVEWSTVRKSLTGYLNDDARLYSKVKDYMAAKGFARGTTARSENRWTKAMDREYSRILDRHLAILKRYARVAKR
jgi:hypothetical protein